MTTNFNVDSLFVNFINGNQPLINPATTKGDLIVDDGTALQRLGVGANAFVLTADSSQALGMTWAAVPAGFTNPMTTAGDVIMGGSGGTATRLGIGTAGFVLTSVAGAPAWAAAFTNPMTAKGDLIAGGAAGAAGRLSASVNGYVLTLDSSQTLGVKWAPAASTGNPPNYNAQTGTTYTLQLTDAPAASSCQGIVSMNNAAANAVTVPPQSSQAWQAGTIFQIPQLGAGQTSVVAGAGVTLNTAASLLARVRFSSIILTYLGSDQWLVGGDIA